jgi:hypothetical protein
MHIFWPHFRARAGSLFVFGAALLLVGCGHMRYQGDSNGFNNAYADSSNRQMLLNLARLDQHDPTYFLQFGQISVSYQFTSSVSGGITNTIPVATQHVPILGESATAGLGASTQPSFTFIPVNDEQVAQELLQPVNSDVLYALFEEGAPVDELLRLMVERLEIHLPGNPNVTVFTNSPVDDNSSVHNGEFSYATFLKICALARQLQLADCLELTTETKFKELAKGWSSPTVPTAWDILSAHDKGLIYKQEDGAWKLGTMLSIPKFVLKPGSEKVIAELKEKSDYYKQGVSLDNMAKILSSGFSVEGKLKDPTNKGSHLVLRSFLMILAAAAQEQNGYQAYFVPSKYFSSVPPEERRPLLKLRWNSSDGPLESPLMELNYRGIDYKVTDLDTGEPDQRSTWNRDMFRLIVQLASQVSVDISKFQLPTTLQVVP